MSTNDDQVSVKITADSTELKSGMGQASDATARALANMSTAVSNLATLTERQTKVIEESFKGVGEQTKRIEAQTKTAFESISGKVTGFSKDVQTQMGKVAETFEQIQKPMIALAAITAGGAFFKEAISVTNRLNGEAIKLSKSLGITGEEAATLRTALGDIYTDSDTYIGAFQKFAKQIKSNEDGLQAMGLQTRDSNGHLRDGNELFTEALHTVGAYKPGLDQTTAAMTLFGKGVDDVMALQKLNNKVLEDAKEKNEALGMTLTKEGVQASKEYKAAMNDVGDVLEAVKNAVGQAVMPVFTELGSYFAESGPYMVNVFKGALTGLVVSFRVVQGAIQTIAGVIFEVISTVVDGAGLMGQTFNKLISGDFGGAYESAKAVGSRIAQGFKNGAAEFQSVGDEVGAKVAADMDRIWGKGTAVTPEKSGNGTMGDMGSSKGKDKQDPGRAPAWEADLAAQKDALERKAATEGRFREMSKQEEADYWASILQRTDLTTNEKLAVQKKYYALEAQVRKDAFDAQITELEASKNALGKNYAERIGVAQQSAQRIAEAYGVESKEAKKAYADILKEVQAFEDQRSKIERHHTEAQYKINQIAIESAEKAALADLELVGATDVQKIALQRQYLDQRFAMEQQDIERRKALIDPERDPEQYAKLKDQLLEVEAKYQAQKSALQGKATAVAAQPINNILAGTQQSFAQALNGMMQHTNSFGQGMQKVWKSVGSSVRQELANMTAAMVMNLAKQALMGKTQVMQQAYKAAASAYQAMVGIPIVGPVIAPIAAVGTFAAVSAYGAQIPSASAGFDIPAGVNPLTQLHEKEMVLPAEHAETIRNMGGGGGGGETHVHVHALDSHDVRAYLRRGGADEIVRALKERSRNGVRA